MVFLGLGGGRFSSWSAGSSGSCLMIPDQHRQQEQVLVDLTAGKVMFSGSEGNHHRTLLLQHLVGIRDLGLVR